MGVAGLGQAVLERAIVSKQQQAFAVEVEAADGVDVRDGDVTGQRLADWASSRLSGAGRELAQYVERFVEDEVLERQANSKRTGNLHDKHGCLLGMSHLRGLPCL